ncbi:hypothetical protein DFJ73DRAFT_845454, partial [Zopfochytrium polystomum]
MMMMMMMTMTPTAPTPRRRRPRPAVAAVGLAAAALFAAAASAAVTEIKVDVTAEPVLACWAFHIFLVEGGQESQVHTKVDQATADANRRAGGCGASSSPNSIPGVAIDGSKTCAQQYAVPGRPTYTFQCDEYPPASSAAGGVGTDTMCIPGKSNGSGGSDTVSNIPTGSQFKFTTAHSLQELYDACVRWTIDPNGGGYTQIQSLNQAAAGAVNGAIAIPAKPQVTTSSGRVVKPVQRLQGFRSRSGAGRAGGKGAAAAAGKKSIDARKSPKLMAALNAAIARAKSKRANFLARFKKLTAAFKAKAAGLVKGAKGVIARAKQAVSRAVGGPWREKEE